MISTSDPLLTNPFSTDDQSIRLGRSWLREPLLHFLLIGATLFAIDHFVSTRADDPHVIVMGPEVDREARDVFQASRGRLPNANELAALRQAWLDNEVLYREGLAMRVDRGDKAIRDRVIFKALSVVDADVKPPPVDEKTLRAWFEKNRAKYDEPARFDFQEAVISGDQSEAAVNALVQTLKKGSPGELNAGLRVFKGRPLINIMQGYGEDFARQLAQSQPGIWRSLRSNGGWRAVRLDATTSARSASFEAMHGVVLQDWTDDVMAQQRTDAVRALAKKYNVKMVEAKP